MNTYSKLQMFWLVVLRILVGWHFLYEGLAKILNLKWTSMGYLMDSQGWFASWFDFMANNKNLLAAVDFMNEWGLFLIGLGLIAGCLSRLACMGGIVLLGLYCLSHPHFIGVEYMLPFEGSYLFVDKNLVELGALAVLYVFPMSWTVSETYSLRNVIKQTGVTFQLGHQGRQTDSYIRAKQVIDKGILGHVSLIEVCTNRNDPNGAWVYEIHANANPDRDLTMLYSATLANQRRRGKVFMGHDASMELSSSFTVNIDPRSTRYAEQIKEGVIKPDTPLMNYMPGQTDVDAISSATELYFAQRGLLYAYVNGKRYDTTYLHIREWIECIRNGITPSCNIDAAFEEAMTAHMGTRAYLEGRTMYWDKEKEEIIRG